MMRCILVILDGLGDKGHAAFGGQTPLQAASTPHLDRLAALGMNGLYHSWLQGVAMPSEMAHFLLFGYDREEFPGRGLIEALGEGLTMDRGEVALLARLFSVGEIQGRLVIDLYEPPVEPAERRALIEMVRFYREENIEIEFLPTRALQGLAIMRGAVSVEITDSNPIHPGRPLMEILPLKGWERDGAAQRTSRVLTNYVKWCYRRLSTHPVNQKRVRAGLPPVNAAGTQRPGTWRSVEPFEEKWGLRPLAIASRGIYRGLSQYLGMDRPRIEDSAKPGEDLLKRLRLAAEARDYDFVYVHTKAPDEAAHTKDPRIKREVIEDLDGAFAYALEAIVPEEDTLLVVTSDHSTNSDGQMIHSGETVPLTMVGKYTRRDAVKRFDEVHCAPGALGLVRGKELMYMILNLLDRGKLYGLMDSPVDQPYSPGKYKALII
jgi:2,3-bisphosphoglycerate-independent phosphoglycerate mutase